MKNVIKFLKEKQANLNADVAAIDQVRKVVDSDSVEEKRKELRSMEDEIDSAISILECHREIKLLSALIDDDKLRID